MSLEGISKPQKTRWNLLAAACMLLVAGSYLDNVRGPMLPMVARELQIGLLESSWFLVLGCLGAVACTFASMHLLNRYAERSVSLTILLGTIATCGFAGLVASYLGLLVLAIAIGICVALCGSMSSVIALQSSSPQHQSRALLILHAMYGLGSFAASFSAIWVAHFQWSWRPLLLGAVPCLLLVGLHVWQALAKEPPSFPTERRQPTSLNGLQLLSLAVFAFYVAGEVATSMWMTTYLIEAEAFSLERASEYLTYFFLIMAITRGLAAVFLAGERHENVALAATLVIAILFFLAAMNGTPALLPFTGCLGPFYPLLAARVSRRSPAQWRNMAIWVVISVQVSLVALHYSIGRLGAGFGIQRGYVLAPVMLGITLVALIAMMACDACASKPTRT